MDFSGLPKAVAIDPVQDYLGIDSASLNATLGINRNTLLGISSAPVGLTDTQSLSNKTILSPSIVNGSLSGTFTGNYTLGGSPSFPSNVALTTGAQTIDGKTLTNATLTSPNITNASLSSDSINGYTAANSGTIYGVPITAGAISSASAIGAGVITNNAIANGGLYVTKFNNPSHFSCYRSTGLGLSNGNAWNLITFDTKEYDAGNNYSTSTGYFTVPYTGYYSFSSCVAWNLAASGDLFITSLWKTPGGTGTPTEIRRGNLNYNSTGSSNNINSLVSVADIYFTAGDTVYIQCFPSQPAALEVGSAVVYFNGRLNSTT